MAPPLHRAPRTTLLQLYTGLATTLVPLALPLLAVRTRRGKEDRTRRAERFGHAATPRPDGRLIWVHAASVGELVSVLPLIDRLLFNGRVLVTTGTVTSARVAAERLPAGAIHAVAPLVVPRCVPLFCGYWRPDLAIFVESELWPATVLVAHRAGIPLALVNARMSERSARRWARLPGTIAALLGCFRLCLAQSEADAERLRALGAPGAISTGNLKMDAEPPPADENALSALRRAIGSRPVLVAASTHPGEEVVVAEAHRRLVKRIPDLLTILVPRHPERGPALIEELAGFGPIARRTSGMIPDADIALYVADTLGELGTMYRLATAVLLGGSLVQKGGHNPVEPILLGVPVLHGPSTQNFQEAYDALESRGGTATVIDAYTLARQAARLLEQPETRAAMARAAEAVVRDLSGALERTLIRLQPLLQSPRDASPPAGPRL